MVNIGKPGERDHDYETFLRHPGYNSRMDLVEP